MENEKRRDGDKKGQGRVKRTKNSKGAIKLADILTLLHIVLLLAIITNDLSLPFSSHANFLPREIQIHL